MRENHRAFLEQYSFAYVDASTTELFRDFLIQRSFGASVFSLARKK